MNVPYPIQWGLTLLLAVLTFVVTGVLAQADGLELSRRIIIGMGIANGVLGLVQTALPKLFHPPSPDRAGLD